MTKVRKTQESKTIQRTVTLTGITDIMFDAYAGDNKTQLRPDQKFYFDRDGKTLVMPATNLLSFLTAENTMSAPKRLLDSRSYKKVAQACRCFVSVTPQRIQFLRNGKPIVFTGFDEDEEDKEAMAYIDHRVARLDKGVPNPKHRPTLREPWSLTFTLSMFRNAEVTEEQLQNLFIGGGVTVGLGTYRGVFGKFKVTQWE